MCGIVGVFARRPDDAERSRLANAFRKMEHRGPDGQGIHAHKIGDGELLLGHRRLSIIDLSDDGLQPMKSDDGRYTLVFNGEIYNYVELRAELAAKGRRFQTRTDTEVLLQAWAEWGSDCLDRLDGMFAFAIYDGQNQRLYCARDPFGIKPFFYSFLDNRFGFASEIPALLELKILPLKMNRSRARNFLCWGNYDDGRDTFYEDIYQLRPGELMIVDLGRGVRIVPITERWWHSSIIERSDLSLDEAAGQLRELFLQSVRRQLRSDVALGATLSGGVDSSAIVCAIRYLEPDFPIHTFSYGASEARLNERKWADVVNGHVGALAHWVDDEPGDMGDELDDIIKTQGEPFGSTSIAAGYRVLRLARENGITVTLDGQGADELLAGYDGYPAAAFLSRLDRYAYGELARFVASWKKWPGRSWRGAVVHLGDALVPPPLRDSALRMAGHNPTPDWLNAKRLNDFGEASVSMLGLPRNSDARGRRLPERLRIALTSNRLPALLRHSDRNSMRWSIESRVPFLSSELVRFALSLPEDYLLSRDGETKHVFRHAMRGIVPDAILQRRDKIGFETPEREILNRSRGRMEMWLEAGREIDFINFEPFRQEVRRILDGNARFSFRAWRMINFCRWFSLQGQIT